MFCGNTRRIGDDQIIPMSGITACSREIPSPWECCRAQRIFQSKCLPVESIPLINGCLQRRRVWDGGMTDFWKKFERCPAIQFPARVPHPSSKLPFIWSILNPPSPREKAFRHRSWNRFLATTPEAIFFLLPEFSSYNMFWRYAFFRIPPYLFAVQIKWLHI